MGLFTRAPASEAGLPPPPVSVPRALTAGAERIRVSDKQAIEKLREARSDDSDWQTRAWDAYEGIGEIHFAFSLVGNVISRIRFYAAAEVTPNVAPAYVEDVADLTPGLAQAALAAMRRITDTQGDFSSLARDLAINLSVPGEAYLVQIPGATTLTERGVETSPESWEIRSKDEVLVSTDRNAPIKVRSRPGDPESRFITLPRAAFVGRIWRRSPRFTALADSSMRAVLDSVDELMLINQGFRATARSRLNSGILFIPDGLTASSPTQFPATVEGEAGTAVPLGIGSPPPADIDEFEESLLEGMMTPILDPSDASAVVPILVRGPAELGEKIRLISFERTFDPSLVQRADRVLERILAGIDLPKDIVSGLAEVRYCADPETKILTRTGWKHYWDLQLGEDVLTYNQDTELSEWQPAQAINVFDVEDEPMLRIKQRGHDSLTTLDHRWPVFRLRQGKIVDKTVVTSRELNQTHRVPVAAPHAAPLVEPKYSDAFVELVAWYAPEGHAHLPDDGAYDDCIDRDAFVSWVTSRMRDQEVSYRTLGAAMGGYTSTKAASNSAEYAVKRGCSTPGVRARLADALESSQDAVDAFFAPRQRRGWAYVTQSETANPEKTARIRRALTTLYGPAFEKRADGLPHEGPAWHELRLATGAVNFYLNHEAAEPLWRVCEGEKKVVRLDFVQQLTESQLELFIQTSVDADGTRSGNRMWFGQEFTEQVDALELACILAGRAVHRYVVPTASVPHQITIKKRSWVQPARYGNNNSIERYTGQVWCPTTPNGTWFAQRNGTQYITSNSNAVVIEESLWRAHIEPLTLLICDAITDVYLRPALVAMGYTFEQAARIRLWYDPSEVVARPNRNQDAVQAFDRYQLSGRSLREAMGFNEADAPRPAELLLRMLLQKGPMTPDLAEALMRHFAPLAMGAAQQSAQESSENPLPPEVQQLLNPGAAPSPAPTAESEQELAPPAPPAEPAADASNVRGPRGGRPAEVPIGDGISLLPPTPREPRGPTR